MEPEPAEFHPVELPHAGKMCWVHEAALSADGRTTVARVRVAADHPFVQAGRLVPAALIEFMAQAAAAGLALKASSGQRKVKRGLLVALREFTIWQEVLVGDLLEITATHEKSLGALSQALVEVRRCHAVVARARMTFHLEFG